MDSSSQKQSPFSAAAAVPPATSLFIVALACCLALPSDAIASTSSLPWDGPIQKIAERSM